MRYAMIVIASVLSLTGCSSNAALLKADLDYIQQAASTVLRLRLSQRAFIRATCWTRMQQRVAEADKNDTKDGDKILADNMPSLITVTLLRDAIDDGIQLDALEELDTPYGCEVSE